MGSLLRAGRAAALWVFAFGAFLFGTYQGATAEPRSAWQTIAPLLGFLAYLVLARAAMRAAAPRVDQFWRTPDFTLDDQRNK